MKLVEFSTQRRVTVAMLMVAIIVFGGVGFSRLAVNLLPDITYPTITVRTEYPGAAPGEAESQVSRPIEESCVPSDSPVIPSETFGHRTVSEASIMTFGLLAFIEKTNSW